MRTAIKSHILAAKELNEVKNLAINLIKEGRTERQIVEFIIKEYNKRGLKTMAKPKAIVSFAKNTSEIHHFPKSHKIKHGPIMLDIWAKQPNGCFADLTWMFYKGKPDKKFIFCFNEIVKARNKALNFLKNCLKDKYLPTMFEIDAISRAYLAEKRLGYAFRHRIGHMLGKKVHAGGRKEYYERLKLNTPYTIEPGIYMENFGVRLENDFWIDEKLRIHMTKIQNKLIII